MKEFLQLNAKKLPFIVGVSLLVSGLLAAAIAAISIISQGGWQNYMSLPLLIAFAVICSLIIFVGAIVSEYYWFARRKKLFRREILSAFFDQNGFVCTHTNTETRNSPTQLIMRGEIDGFTVNADLIENAPKKIQMDFIVQKMVIDKTNYYRLDKIFDGYGAAFGFGSVYMELDLADFADIAKVKDRLKALAAVLTQEGFMPVSA